MGKSIADALNDLGICKTSNQPRRAELTREACTALGIEALTTYEFPTERRGRYGENEISNIIGWIVAKYAEPIELDNVVPVTQKRNKTKRDKRFSGFTRISFNVTGNAQRQHISLEPEFIKALELIAPDNRNQWLGETVDKWIEANGVESSTRIVKCEIVNELIKRAMN